MLFLATAAAAVMGGDPAREAEEYYKRGDKYFHNVDMEASIGCFMRAAALGHAKALCRVGLFYVKRDSEQAQKYFADAEPGLLKLAEQGDAEAQIAVAFFGPGNRRNDYWLKRAVNNFRAAAARGDAKAQIQLGKFYEIGDAVNRDLAEALKWYRKAADQGHPEATCIVGVFYLCGQSVKPDHEEALKWLLLAADRGYTLAEFVIAEHYEFDKKDMAEAMKWYRRSAEHGNKLAQWSLRERNEHPENPRERITAISHVQTDPAPADF